MERIICIIAGSRSVDNYDFCEPIIDKFFSNECFKGKDICIMSGTAKGADRVGETYAHRHGLDLKRRPAQWNRQDDGTFDRAAGYVRNERMGEEADIALILWDGESRGSKHMYNIMKKLGKPVLMINLKTYEITQ